MERECCSMLSAKTINMTTNIDQTDRTRVRRIPKRGVFDRETIYSILDEGFICHVGFAVDGKPFVLPTGYARIGDRLLIHGSAASRMMREISGGIDVCLTVTLIDGLVLARSAFHHSMNYRSVVVFGTARQLTDEDEKMEALRALTEHIVPGRWPDVRWPNAKELKATTVLTLPIEEASAKVRTGGPIDDEEDYELDTWAGVLPLEMKTDAPIGDTRLKNGTPIPPHVSGYRRNREPRITLIKEFLQVDG
jgi:nitroimidazol reductase NimA-like FMN-containing flavoprotein (pyridoxamine 5'-phosphate oxidase superfamily)